MIVRSGVHGSRGSVRPSAIRRSVISPFQTLVIIATFYGIERLLSSACIVPLAIYAAESLLVVPCSTRSRRVLHSPRVAADSRSRRAWSLCLLLLCLSCI